MEIVRSLSHITRRVLDIPPQHTSVISIVLGVVMGMGLNAPSVWIASIISLFLILCLLERPAAVSRSKKIVNMLLFSISYMGTVLIWFWWTLPLDWLGVESHAVPIVLVFLYWATTAAVLSVPVFLTLFLFLKLRKHTFWDIPLFAFLWVFFEYARTWVFAVLTFGSESLFGPHFSVGFIGYTLAEHLLLLQLAILGGVYVLSFTSALIVSAMYYAWVRRYIKGVVLVILVLYSTSFLPTSWIESLFVTGNEKLAVALVTTDFPSVASISTNEQERRQSILEVLFDEVVAHDDPPDIIVFPEDARFVHTLQEKYGESTTQAFLTEKAPEALIIDSSRVAQFGTSAQSRIFYYSGIDNKLTHSHKRFLIPQGEYTPTLHSLALQLFGQSELLDQFNARRAYSKSDQVTVGKHNEARIGTLFCSEVLSPVLYQRLVKEQEVDVLVNVASQSIFHHSDIIFHQVQAIAKVHAVANQRYFLQASNAAPSFIISPWGSVEAQSSERGSSILHVTVSL